ncbi:TIR domain-containing protein [Maricaulis sp. MIT060901]|uniref:TIR domain-containing protein n=1 Tax=Maricaulis sp. MIT060901 TaxID=3096993 RepID=UPI00399AFFD2
MTDVSNYAAFISYSHDDERFARWLHRQLETYRIPKHLVTADGAVPGRIGRIFRDRDDLPAANDLSAVVQDALASSAALIVVCSPSAAKSQWVNREVEVFRELHPDRPILAAITAGEPGGEDSNENCYPPTLRRPREDGGFDEPAGADFRPGKDGKRTGVVKLVAGLFGLPLDQILQRDLQRRQRRVTAVTVVTSALALIMTSLSLLAMSARSEAEHRKAEAEDLIEFMLTDLKAQLQPVGRLDVLDAVGEKVIEYYSAQPSREMTADSLGRSARARHMLAEIELAQGDLQAARGYSTSAFEATRVILERDPTEPARIYEHSQSSFWLGYFAFLGQELDIAEARWDEYRQLTEQLVEIDPTNLEWLNEAGHARNNMGIVQMRRGNLEEAEASFEYGRDHFASAFQQYPTNAQRDNLAGSYGWLASVREENMDAQGAILHLLEQIEVLNGAENFEDDWRLRRDAMVAEANVARMYLYMRAPPSAESVENALVYLIPASLEAQALVRHEPDRVNWRINAVRTLSLLVDAHLFAGEVAEARAAMINLSRLMSHESWETAELDQIGEARVQVRASQMRLLAAIGEEEASRSEGENLLVQFARAREDGSASSQDYIYTLLISNFLAEQHRAAGRHADADTVLGQALTAYEARPEGVEHIFLRAQLEQANALAAAMEPAE